MAVSGRFTMQVVFEMVLVMAVMVLGSEARLRHYKWKISYVKWAPDCFDSAVIGINGQFPGPTIYADEGDTIVVDVENQIPTENVVIHWHGIRQIGTPWNDGAASVTQCAILPGEKYSYKYVVDQAGTYFYHGHYGMQRTAGLYGSIIVKSAKKEPFTYDAELSILVNDWWHKSIYEQSVGLSSLPFQWVGEPQSLLIEGRGKFNCSEAPSLAGRTCNTSNPQCSPHVMKIEARKTYRLRIGSVASLSSLNLAIQNHTMRVVEADGHFVEPFDTDNLDIYSGETYSVLITANQDPTRNYWLALNVRGREPKTPPGLAILSYVSPTQMPTGNLPEIPAWNDFRYSMDFARRVKALRDAAGGDYPAPPSKADRLLRLLNTQNKLNGYMKWAVNNVSLVPPTTPYLAAMKYGIRGALSGESPSDVYSPADYDILRPPANPNTTEGSGVYVLAMDSVVDVVLQNANTLTPNNSEIHPWHLHGHDFWVLGHGSGVFDDQAAKTELNLENPPLRNTVAVFPWGWTVIRFRASNPGVWAFHCHVEAHFFMGMGVIFSEGVDRVHRLPSDAMGCGLTRQHFMRIP